MKLKRVAAICSKEGIFCLFNQTDEEGEIVRQWLGTGNAVYPIDGLPYMGGDNICAMFDIPEKKREKLIIRHDNTPDSINWEDSDPTEYQIDDPKLCVRYNGWELLPLCTSHGIIFIREKYLAPLDSLEYMRLFERKSKSGAVYIVAKVGLVIQAVIMPTDIINEEFVEKMGELTEMCRIALMKKNAGEGAGA